MIVSLSSEMYRSFLRHSKITVHANFCHIDHCSCEFLSRIVLYSKENRRLGWTLFYR